MVVAGLEKGAVAELEAVVLLVVRRDHVAQLGHSLRPEGLSVGPESHLAVLVAAPVAADELRRDTATTAKEGALDLQHNPGIDETADIGKSKGERQGSSCYYEESR